MLAMQTRRALPGSPLLIVLDVSGSPGGPRDPQWEARGFRVRRLRVGDVDAALEQLERHALSGADGPQVVWLSLERGGGQLEELLASPRLARKNVAIAHPSRSGAYELRLGVDARSDPWIAADAPR